MNDLTNLKKTLGKNQKDIDFTRLLYLVMIKVGGYNQLMDLSLSAFGEILKCMEWQNKEENKGSKKIR